MRNTYESNDPIAVFVNKVVAFYSFSRLQFYSKSLCFLYRALLALLLMIKQSFTPFDHEQAGAGRKPAMRFHGTMGISARPCGGSLIHFSLFGFDAVSC